MNTFCWLLFDLIYRDPQCVTIILLSDVLFYWTRFVTVMQIYYISMARFCRYHILCQLLHVSYSLQLCVNGSCLNALTDSSICFYTSNLTKFNCCLTQQDPLCDNGSQRMTLCSLSSLCWPLITACDAELWGSPCSPRCPQEIRLAASKGRRLRQSRSGLNFRMNFQT